MTDSAQQEKRFTEPFVGGCGEVLKKTRCSTPKAPYQRPPCSQPNSCLLASPPANLPALLPGCFHLSAHLDLLADATMSSGVPGEVPLYKTIKHPDEVMLGNHQVYSEGGLISIFPRIWFDFPTDMQKHQLKTHTHKSPFVLDCTKLYLSLQAACTAWDGQSRISQLIFNKDSDYLKGLSTLPWMHCKWNAIEFLTTFSSSLHNLI